MAKRPTDRIKLKMWTDRMTSEYDGATVEGLAYCGWGLLQAERNTLIGKLAEQRATVAAGLSVEHDEATLHVDDEAALQTIDAAFFSGDAFHGPEALSRAEYFLHRWLREAERIRSANFYEPAEGE